MIIEKRWNINLNLCDTETKQLLEGLKYIRHRFDAHLEAGIHSTICKPTFINELIKQLECIK